MNSIRTYLQRIQQDISAGMATEHTHRPALKTLLEELLPGVTATNEPKHVACGAPDFVVTRRAGGNMFTLGYIEAKDVGKSLDQIERSEQMKRYLNSLDNLILTDYLEFRWYVNGERRRVAQLGNLQSGGKIQKAKSGEESVGGLLTDFMAHQPETIQTPRALAERLARLAHLIRDVIVESFQQEQTSHVLLGIRKAFADILIADLELPEKTGEFADMFAQTLAYGLFSARIMDPTPGDFSRQEAQRLIPKTNPFLRDFFYQVSGPQLDDEPYAPFVDDLVAVLAHTDIDQVLADFGKRTRQEDPVVHFYETFLAAYDPKLREARGVYYTPEPVVSYIVRSVDHLLKSRFGLAQGLADTSQMTIENRDPNLVVRGTRQMRKTTESHRVLILDPAAGTGTFLYTVVDFIRQNFMQSGNAGMWPGYVRDHLLPRLFGFELLMAPYAVAHFKLALQLAGHDLPPEQRAMWAYDFKSDERIQMYLTNTLEGAHEDSGLPLFTQFLARETLAANQVKQDLPIMVVLGNPPYSGHSSNRGDWIGDLLRGKLPDGGQTENYYEVDGGPLGERNPKWLQDDYVKFIRWAQWRIDQSGAGILAFISNHGYLDNPTFRGMRQSLMSSFDEIFVLDLHGNAKKKEVAPDGSPDQNVFDIQQGVAIGIFVKYDPKNPPPPRERYRGYWHADLWGARAAKYEWLFENDISTTTWDKLEPQKPYHLFIPGDIDLLGEFQKGWLINDIYSSYSMGITTGRDKFATSIESKELETRIRDLASQMTDDAIRQRYKLKDSSSFVLSNARKWAKEHSTLMENVKPVAYRCFDARYVIYSGDILARSREDVFRHVLGATNKVLISSRRIRKLPWMHAFVSKQITTKEFISSLDNCFAFPVYLSDEDRTKTLFDTQLWKMDDLGRVPNLNPEFVQAIEQKLGLKFKFPPQPDSKAESVFGPEDIFHYIYAIFHSLTYRERYSEFLKIDFPRVPLTSDAALFWQLVELGRQLVGLHLLEAPQVGLSITSYPVPGDNRVERGYPKYDEISQRVLINKTQYFEGVPAEVWAFQVGGYQICDKWLKDRRGRLLTFDELAHYQKVIVALRDTIHIMAEIDVAIPEWPVQ